METGTWKVKTGLAQMLKGGVIMDVVTPEQAKIAENAGACAVMALERVPADIRAAGGVARMADPSIIEAIMKTVSIPVMAKCRIGHFVEAQVLEALGVDYIDESEVLTPADESHHIWKHDFKVPFVCGCRDLGEALRRIGEGAAMIRTKGEAGTGNIVEAVRHMRAVMDSIRKLVNMPEDEIMAFAKEMGAPFEILMEVHKAGKLPVVNFAAGGVATPSDAALMMQLGADGIFVGSGIFKSSNPDARAKAIVKATTHFKDAAIIAEASKSLGEAMPGLEIKKIPPMHSCQQEVGSMKIGVLAAQGAFVEHIDSLQKLGVEASPIRLLEQLADLDGLVIPGGESTSISRIMQDFNLSEGITKLAKSGKPVFGTCAGMILLANEVSDRQLVTPLKLMSIRIRRNAFGRQIDSFETDLSIPVLGKELFHAIFIRAPLIEEVSDVVKVLARLENGQCVAVRQGNLLACAFHPELTDDLRFHQYFVDIAAGRC